MLSETIGPYNAIGRIAMLEVELALRAGFKVTVVAKRLTESLRGRVEWRKLYVPSRGFALQWLTGRHYIKKALGDHTAFDLIWGHQPQIADLCDVYNCQFLTRAAYDKKGFDRPTSLRGFLGWLQQHVVLHAEDRFYHRWNPNTHMVFCSELVRREFALRYGMPPSQEVLVNPAPVTVEVDVQDRLKARQTLTGTDSSKIVLGYLGGIDARKGYQEVIQKLKGQDDIFLLMGGNRSAGFQIPELAGHHRSIGLVENLKQFYSACDVFIVPSRFDPCPLVVFEAAAHGIPVIATSDVGNSSELLQFNAGKVWNPVEPLAPIVRELHSNRTQYQQGGQKMCSAVSTVRFETRLMELIEQAKEESGQDALLAR